MPDDQNETTRWTHLWAALQELGAALNAIAESADDMPDEVLALVAAVDVAHDIIEDRALEEEPANAE